MWSINTYCIGGCSLWAFFSLIVSDVFFTDKVFRIVYPLFLPVLLPKILKFEAGVKYYGSESEWLRKDK